MSSGAATSGCPPSPAMTASAFSSGGPGPPASESIPGMADQSGCWHENMAGARRGIARALPKRRGEGTGYSEGQDLAPRGHRTNGLRRNRTLPTLPTVLAIGRLAKPTDAPVFGALSFPDARRLRSVDQRGALRRGVVPDHRAPGSADESSAATAMRSVVLMSQNSSQATQYASIG